MLDDPKDGGKTGRTRGQNPNAGWYNRFVQTGKSDHETKCNGCFGGSPLFILRRPHPVIAGSAYSVAMSSCRESDLRIRSHLSI